MLSPSLSPVILNCLSPAVLKPQFLLHLTAFRVSFLFQRGLFQIEFAIQHPAFGHAAPPNFQRPRSAKEVFCYLEAGRLAGVRTDCAWSRCECWRPTCEYVEKAAQQLAMFAWAHTDRDLSELARISSNECAAALAG